MQSEEAWFSNGFFKTQINFTLLLDSKNLLFVKIRKQCLHDKFLSEYKNKKKLERTKFYYFYFCPLITGMQLIYSTESEGVYCYDET